MLPYFGFEDPATTGQVLGGLSILYPICGEKMELCPEFTEEIVRHREEVSEQIQALKQFERMCAAYGFDVTKPATNAREAVQWTYFGYLGAVKDQYRLSSPWNQNHLQHHCY